MNFRMEISYFLGIMTYPLLRSLPPSPRVSFLVMGGFNMADGYCLAFTGHSLGRRPYLLLFVRLHSGT